MIKIVCSPIYKKYISQAINLKGVSENRVKIIDEDDVEKELKEIETSILFVDENFEGTQNLCGEVQPSNEYFVCSVPLNAINRITDIASDSIKMDIMILEPTSSYDGIGPIDSFIFNKPIMSQYKTNNIFNTSIQKVTCPHTRCFLINFNIEFSKYGESQKFVDNLYLLDRTLVLKDDDTASISEFFRDIGRPSGAFYENVILDKTLYYDEKKVCFWMCAHYANIIPEILDTIFRISQKDISAQIHNKTNKLLGVVNTKNSWRKS